MLQLIRAALAVSLIVLGATTAAAQQWPQRVVKIVVPYSPGGNADTMGRITAQWLTAAIGQQFIVDNRAGAGGAIGADFVAKSPPDGYTLCVCALSQLAAVPLTQKVAYDPLKDFAPVANIGANGFVITVTAKLPVTTLQEFVTYVKARPGKLNYGSGGNGSLTQLSAALFLHHVGLDMTHVPYKGGAQPLTETIAGQLEMYSASPSEVLPHLGTGTIKLLGISSDKRIPQLPDVPAIAEFYPGFRAVTWNGLFAPAGTPAAIVLRLADAVQQALKDPAFLDRLEKMGVEPVPTTPASFTAEIKGEYAMWRDVIKSAGLLVE
jgi:tripartite-type tricarboxylate transporter receptor subunit TctC